MGRHNKPGFAATTQAEAACTDRAAARTPNPRYRTCVSPCFGLVRPISLPSTWFFMTLTRIPLDARNRMLRLGLGLHEGRFFLRVDLWWTGFRFS